MSPRGIENASMCAIILTHSYERQWESLGLIEISSGPIRIGKSLGITRYVENEYVDE